MPHRTTVAPYTEPSFVGKNCMRVEATVMLSSVEFDARTMRGASDNVEKLQ